ncbi:MAG TPA: glycosyltransferase, partial [Anaerolineaceae bacterium]
MKILFVVPYVPNLIRVRPYNLVRSLAKRGHEITLMTLWSSEAELRDVEALKPVCADVQAVHLPSWRSLLNAALALPVDMPLQANYCWHPELDRRIHAELAATGPGARYDAVHVEHLRGVRYALSALSAAHNGKSIPVFWDSVDCITYLFEQAVRRSRGGLRRAVLQFDLARTRRYEGKMAANFSRVFVTSRVDQQKLGELAPQPLAAEHVAVIPNGVDLDYFQPDPREPRCPASLVISGKMSYHANVAMALELVNKIMPIVWSRKPDVEVKIVGKDPPAAILELASNPRVVVTGTVPDIRPYLRQATIAAAPLAYGAGIQNKVLEAMAC